MNKWFRFQNAATDSSVVDIHIIDFIGDWWDDAGNRVWGEAIGVTARAFVEQLAKLPEAVTALRVHINSPGGDVQGGINIANALREQQTKGRTVETFVDGIAASIASVIAMAGSRVHMADNALMMIHNPWTVDIGSAADLRKTADVLDAMRGQIVATYRWHSALEPAALEALMDAETWLSAEEALAHGLVTDVVEGLQAAASISRASLKTIKVPEQYRARVEAFLQPPAPPAAPPPAAASAADLLAVCREHGASMEVYAELLGAGLPMAEARTRVAADKARREAETARAEAIRGICGAAKAPQLAEGYIAGAMTIDAVKAHLTTITALVDGKLTVDGGLPPDQGVEAAGAGWKRAFDRVNKRGRR